MKNSKKLNEANPIEWAKAYIEELNKKENEHTREITLTHSPQKLITKNEQHTFNGGYLFLQKIYYNLELHQVYKEITKKYKFTFDLNSILSRLVYSRIIFPSSKLTTSQLAEKFLEPLAFELQHIYRALEILTKEMDFIQTSLYQNSLKISKCNTDVLYYNCTNSFF